MPIPPLRDRLIACLGPAGTYTEDAAIALAGPDARRMLCPSLDDAFRAAESGIADHAVVAVENSNEGSVGRTLDLLATSPLKVRAECSLDIRHQLLTREGTLQGVEWVRGHAQALAQCQQWLCANAPHLKHEAVSSNAEAARLASLDATSAAIASRRAAIEFRLGTVCDGIQDDAVNRTRFLLLGAEDAPWSPQSKTSLILSISNRAGSLYRALEPFEKHGVSMSRLESRPCKRGVWEYLFYIDLVGHRLDEPVAAALRLLDERGTVKLLGSYPSSADPSPES